MANKTHVYKDRDIRRIIRAAQDAKLEPGWALEVDPRTGVTRVIRSTTPAETPAGVNEWDEMYHDGAAEAPVR